MSGPKMRILVAGGFEGGETRAHALNTVKMAQGFARIGHDVALLCRRPAGEKLERADLDRLYGISAPFDWIQLPGDIGIGRRFARSAMAAIARFQPDLVYARNYELPWMTSRIGLLTVTESHAHPDNRTEPFLRLVEAARHRAFSLWVTISRHLADHYRSMGVPAEKLLVAPDAVDLALFHRPERLGRSMYAEGKPAVVYAGHLYDYKGIPTILRAAAQLPDVDFHLVGGLPADVARQQATVRELRLENVTCHGHRPHADVPPFLWHADVLLLPPSGDHPSAQWTSPLKVGEYLASGVPIVATEIPALRDCLTDDQVLFVEPDNATALATGVRRLLGDSRLAMAQREAGLLKAEQLSYTRRAAAVLEHPSVSRWFDGSRRRGQCQASDLATAEPPVPSRTEPGASTRAEPECEASLPPT